MNALLDALLDGSEGLRVQAVVLVSDSDAISLAILAQLAENSGISLKTDENGNFSLNRQVEEGGLTRCTNNLEAAFASAAELRDGGRNQNVNGLNAPSPAPGCRAGVAAR